MSKLTSLFLMFVTILAIIVSLNGFLSNHNAITQIFQILFVPITVYLFVSLASHLTLQSPALGTSSTLSRMLTFYCLIVSCVFVAAGFLSSKSQADYISSLIFAPLALYFLINILPQRNMVTISPTSGRSFVPPSSAPKIDESRRDFLKIVGTAGISIFLYNLLFRRDPAGLFGSLTNNQLSLKNAQGEVIDPAEKSPTQGYYISQIDAEGVTSYYGFINHLGQWFIMRQDSGNSYRYTRGDQNFETSWSNRVKLNYDYFDNVF